MTGGNKFRTGVPEAEGNPKRCSSLLLSSPHHLSPPLLSSRLYSSPPFYSSSLLSSARLLLASSPLPLLFLSSPLILSLLSSSSPLYSTPPPLLCSPYFSSPLSSSSPSPPPLLSSLLYSFSPLLWTITHTFTNAKKQQSKYETLIATRKDDALSANDSVNPKETQERAGKSFWLPRKRITAADKIDHFCSGSQRDDTNPSVYVLLLPSHNLGE